MLHPSLETPLVSQTRLVQGSAHKVETSYHDNDLILTPIISPQSD
jgi:hypothetical protein